MKQNTFDVKWYEDQSLAYWVRKKPVPVSEMKFDQIVESHRNGILESGNKTIDFHRSMRWVMFDWGWVIETNHIDDELTTTVETLVSYTGDTAVLIHRHRFGLHHNEMKPYQRDDLFPIACRVKMMPCF
jgi:hypothetical protein